MHLSLKIIILDVGHGNCTIIIDIQEVTVIDCGINGKILIKTLKLLDITEVHHLIISHADSDHMGGLEPLLKACVVHKIYMNGDALKKGPMWQEGLRAMKMAIGTGTQLVPGITSASPAIITGEVTIEFLSPSPLLSLSGAGGTDPDGRKVSSNTMSIVLRVIHKGDPIALLPADMDELALSELLVEHNNLEAKVLVFPHHGGNCGGDNYAFAQRLCKAVKPELIVPSLERGGRYDNPHNEIMRGIRDACPSAHIMCTQLSHKCCSQLFDEELAHLIDLPAKGKENCACCGGSICINLNGAASTYEPSLPHHRQFVKTLQTETNRQSHAGPLCLR